MDCSVSTPDMLMLMDGGLISKCIVLKKWSVLEWVYRIVYAITLEK